MNTTSWRVFKIIIIKKTVDRILHLNLGGLFLLFSFFLLLFVVSLRGGGGEDEGFYPAKCNSILGHATI